MSDLAELSNPSSKARRLLDERLIGWFTTVGSDGAPRTVPVWFLFADDRVFVLSQPETVKVRNVANDPRVVVSAVAGDYGDDVVVVRGVATLHPGGTEAWLARHREAYIAKYAAAIEDYGTPVEQFAKEFTTVIEVTPEHLLAW